MLLATLLDRHASVGFPSCSAPTLHIPPNTMPVSRSFPGLVPQDGRELRICLSRRQSAVAANYQTNNHGQTVVIQSVGSSEPCCTTFFGTEISRCGSLTNCIIQQCASSMLCSSFVLLLIPAKKLCVANCVCMKLFRI